MSPALAAAEMPKLPIPHQHGWLKEDDVQDKRKWQQSVPIAEQERSKAASHTANCLLCLLHLVSVQAGIRAASEGRHLSLSKRTCKQGQTGLLLEHGLMLPCSGEGHEPPVPKPPSTFPLSLLTNSKGISCTTDAIQIKRARTILLVDILILTA